MTGNLADGSETRVYFVVNSGTLTPTEPQWLSFFNQAKTKPLAAAILAAAHSSQNFIAASKRSQGTGNVLKNTLCAFEIASENVAACIAVLNAQATIRGVSGTVAQKFVGVLVGEMRDSVVDLGFTVPQSQQLTVTLVNGVGSFDRMGAISAVQSYLATNDAIWHAPGG
jgi:hypothetical protein